MEQLLRVLEHCTSHDPQIRKPAEALLQQWEKQPGYHHQLSLVYMDTRIDTKQRSLASILLKNGVDKYWRPTAPGALSVEEKKIIRDRQLQSFDEQNKQISVQQALITARIARHDYPRDWPQLLDLLIPRTQQAFQTQNQEQFNTLYTLHLVMKQLATKTLPMARRHLRQITPQVFSFLLNLYSSLLHQCFSTSDPLAQDLVLSKARICLKTMRRLIVHGFESILESQDCLNLLKSLMEQLPRFMTMRSQYPEQSNGIYATLSSISILIGKLYLDLAQQSPVQFLLQLDPTTEKILVQGLKLSKCLLKHPQLNKLNPDPKDVLAHQKLQSLFTPELVTDYCHLLVTKYLQLTREDLEQWSEDPEAFLIEQESDHWEFATRPCAERVLMDLLSSNRALLGPKLVQMLIEAPAPQNMDLLLLKDAIYNAIGNGAYDLFDYLDFDDLIKTLTLEAQQDSNILKRRISWLIGKWIPVKVSKQVRTQLYQILTHLLDPSQDLVVRLTAVTDLRICVDDFDFEPLDFKAFVQPILSQFLQLLQDTDEFESKMKILQVIIIIAERMEGEIVPFVQPLLQLIPELWQRSEGQNLFRASIVTIMTKLVKSLKRDSLHLHQMVYPVIQQSLDTTNPGHLYLFEEGLELWLSVVQNAPANEQIISLLPIAVNLLEYGTESLKRILRIIEAYCVINPQLLLHYSPQILDKIGLMLENVKPAACGALLHTIHTILLTCYVHKLDIWPSIYQGSLIPRVLQALKQDELSFVIVAHLLLLSRLSLYHPTLFCSYFSATDLSHLLDLYLDKFDNMGQLKQRKLCALGLSALVGTGSEPVLTKLEGIMVCLTSVLVEVKGLDKDETLAFFEAREEEDDETSIEHEHLENLKKQDPVYWRDSLHQSVQESMTRVQEKMGSQFQTLLSTFDPTIVSQLQQSLHLV
ncbi:armadillo-type protein [Gorgonomyces haynaldii]|nr:armadillo-type protein [Gorgonomyces haynaldii]